MTAELRCYISQQRDRIVRARLSNRISVDFCKGCGMSIDRRIGVAGRPLETCEFCREYQPTPRVKLPAEVLRARQYAYLQARRQTPEGKLARQRERQRARERRLATS